MTHDSEAFYFVMFSKFPLDCQPSPTAQMKGMKYGCDLPHMLSKLCSVQAIAAACVIQNSILLVQLFDWVNKINLLLNFLNALLC